MKLLAIVLATAALATAATWDGTRDDLTIFTVQLNASVFGPTAAGMPPDFPPFSTEILVSSTDKSVTAFRVSIEYTDAKGVHADSRTSAISPGGLMTMAFFAGLRIDQISSVSITRLHDGQTTSALR